MLLVIVGGLHGNFGFIGIVLGISFPHRSECLIDCIEELSFLLQLCSLVVEERLHGLSRFILFSSDVRSGDSSGEHPVTPLQDILHAPREILHPSIGALEHHVPNVDLICLADTPNTITCLIVVGASPGSSKEKHLRSFRQRKANTQCLRGSD